MNPNGVETYKLMETDKLNSQQIAYASQKVNIDGVMYHPDLAEDRKGWRYQALHAIHNYGECKDYAIRSRNHDMAFTTVGKLRYGSRRKIHSGYGFQRRYQTSTMHDSYDEHGNIIHTIGPYSPDAKLENFDMGVFD